MSEIVTPVDVERRLRGLGRELDAAHEELDHCENAYASAKSAFEIGVARHRMMIRNQALERGVKVTVQEIEDQALLATGVEYTTLNAAEARVRAARANNVRIRTQIDIARSVGTSVRAAMEVS